MGFGEGVLNKAKQVMQSAAKKAGAATEKVAQAAQKAGEAFASGVTKAANAIKSTAKTAGKEVKKGLVAAEKAGTQFSKHVHGAITSCFTALHPEGDGEVAVDSHGNVRADGKFSFDWASTPESVHVLKFMGVTLGGVTSKSETGYGSGEGKIDTSQRNFSGKVEVGGIQKTIGGFLGSDPNNPLIEVQGEGDIGYAKAEVDSFAGTDGRRHGVAAKLGAEAEAAKGGVTAEANVPLSVLVPPLLRPLASFLDNYTISARVSADGKAGGAGAGLGGHAYYDSEEQRGHAGMSGKFAEALGLGFDLDISIGKKYKSRDRSTD